MKIKINGAEIKSDKHFHLAIKKALNLPEHYGENMDALWDCITGYIELPVEITWTDFSISKEYLGEKFSQEILMLFEEAHVELGEFSYTTFA